NRSPAVVALWPPGLVTVTSTGPTLPGGATARIALLEAGAKLAARFGPKATAVAPESSCPAIVTVVPPVAGPEAGLSTVTPGWPTTSALNASSAFGASDPGSIELSASGGFQKTVSAPGIVAEPRVLPLTLSRPTRCPARIGRSVSKVCSPVVIGLPEALVPAPA